MAGYDGVKNRLAFYDPLTDLPSAAPQGVTDDLATYVVAGWWSDPKLDPLDGRRHRFQPLRTPRTRSAIVW